MSSPFDFNLGTTINGNSNYNVGMNIDPSLFNAAANFRSGLGGGGASSVGFSAGGPAGSAMGPASQQVQDNQLMSHQLNGLLQSDNPYIQQARQDGVNMASRRGLANSSIAGANSVGAAIDRAAPIAQFDASRYGNVSDLNLQMDNASRDRQASAAQAQMRAQAQAMSASSNRQSALDQMLLGHQLGSLDDYRRQMLGIEEREDSQAFGSGQSDIDRTIQQNQFDQNMGIDWARFRHGSNMDWANHGLNRDQLSANVFQNSQSAFMNPITGIFSNPNLTGEQQNAAVQNWMNMAPQFSQQSMGMMPSWMQGYTPSFINPNAWTSAGQLPPMRRGG